MPLFSFREKIKGKPLSNPYICLIFRRGLKGVSPVFILMVKPLVILKKYGIEIELRKNILEVKI
jgi:hypothetical protein